MRKFIVSDIHGLGNVYYAIMNYLENYMIVIDNKHVLSGYLDPNKEYEFLGLTDKEKLVCQWASENFYLSTNTFEFRSIDK